jgi:hypothetical protein
MVLSLVGAELYAAGSKVVNELTSDPAAHPHVKAWPSVFSGISIICNRKHWHTMIKGAGQSVMTYSWLLGLTGMQCSVFQM